MLGPTLETPRLILRPPAAEDFDAFARFATDEEAARYLGGAQSRVTRPLLTLAVTLTSLACGEAGSEASDNTDPLFANDLCIALAEARCEAITRCCPESYPEPLAGDSQPTTCTNNERGACELIFTNSLDRYADIVLAEVDEGDGGRFQEVLVVDLPNHVHYDEQEAAAQIADVRARGEGCESRPMLGLNLARIFRGSLERGQPCAEWVDCAPGLFCSVDSDGPMGTCEELIGVVGQEIGERACNEELRARRPDYETRSMAPPASECAMMDGCMTCDGSVCSYGSCADLGDCIFGDMVGACVEGICVHDQSILCPDGACDQVTLQCHPPARLGDSCELFWECGEGRCIAGICRELSPEQVYCDSPGRVWR